MIKKIIILVILAGAGYVGYLVWSNLSEKEKAGIKETIGDVAKKGHEAAKDAADTITEKIRESSKDDPAGDEKQPAEKPPPLPGQPGKIRMTP